MADFFIGNFNNDALRQQRIRNAALNNKPMNTPAEPQPQVQSKPVIPKAEPNQPQQNLQMNTLKSLDRAIYAKDLMGVPKNINEFIYMMQRGMTTGQFNAMFSSQLAAQRNSISQLQAQILAQLQGLDFSNMSEIVNKQMTTQLQASLKNLDILSNGLINLNQIAQMIQTNGKDALTKLIMTMTQASKMGINDLFTKKCNLSKISDDLYVSNAIQKTFIDLNEKGTKASASTGIIIDKYTTVEENHELIFDKPFIYIIKEKNKENIWFIGFVNRPTMYDENNNIC